MSFPFEPRVGILEADVQLKRKWVIDLEIELAEKTKLIHALGCEKEELQDELDYLNNTHFARVQEKDEEISYLKAQNDDLLRGSTVDALRLELANTKSELIEVRNLLFRRVQSWDQDDTSDKRYIELSTAKANPEASEKAVGTLRRQLMEDREKSANLYAQLDEVQEALEKKDQECQDLKKELEAVFEHSHRLETKLDAGTHNYNVAVPQAKMPQMAMSKDSAADAEKPEVTRPLVPDPKIWLGHLQSQVKHDSPAPPMTPDLQSLGSNIQHIMSQPMSYGKPVATTKPVTTNNAVKNSGLSNIQQLMSGVPFLDRKHVNATIHAVQSPVEQTMGHLTLNGGKPAMTKPAPINTTLPKGSQAVPEPSKQGWFGMTVKDILDPIIKGKVASMTKIHPDVAIDILLNAFLSARGNYEQALASIAEQKAGLRKKAKLNDTYRDDLSADSDLSETECGEEYDGDFDKLAGLV